ncbi:MAG: hypothetical protein MUF03_09100 [Rubrivivax sp.]|jgi:hypothetical protein|nr:hypothetical protein [Rubrivivax sp.]
MNIRSPSILLLALALGGCGAAKTLALLSAYEPTLANSSPVDTTVTNVTAGRDAQGRDAQILSAFFGLDNGLPRTANRAVCEGAGAQDGMPIIFSHEIDVRTMQAGDFKVITASGRMGRIVCVTLAPADDPGELRTALLAGEFGSIDDQPVDVEIVGHLLSIDGSVNFKGAHVRPTRLEDGPSMILAEVVPEAQRALGKPATALPWGGGSGCPVGTTIVLRVTWSGGVTKPGGTEVGDDERRLYQVTIETAAGATVTVTPFALADLGDGDNNHALCLDVAGSPRSVVFPAGHLTDPRQDLNPETRIQVRAP